MRRLRCIHARSALPKQLVDRQETQLELSRVDEETQLNRVLDNGKNTVDSLCEMIVIVVALSTSFAWKIKVNVVEPCMRMSASLFRQER